MHVCEPVERRARARCHRRVNARALLELSVQHRDVQKWLAYQRKLEVHIRELLAHHERAAFLARPLKAAAIQDIATAFVGRLQAEHLKRIGM